MIGTRKHKLLDQFEAALSLAEELNGLGYKADVIRRCEGLRVQWGSLKSEFDSLGPADGLLESRLHQAGKRMVRLCVLRE